MFSISLDVWWIVTLCVNYQPITSTNCVRFIYRTWQAVLYRKCDTRLLEGTISTKTWMRLWRLYTQIWILCLFESDEMYTGIWSFKRCIVCEIQQEIFKTCQEIKPRARISIRRKGMWWWTTTGNEGDTKIRSIFLNVIFCLLPGWWWA